MVHAKARQRFTQALNECFRVVDVSVGPAGVRRRYGFDFVQLKLACDVFDDSGLNRALLFDIRVDQRMFAKQINHAWNAHGEEVDRVDSGFCKERMWVCSASDAKALDDILADFLS